MVYRCFAFAGFPTVQPVGNEAMSSLDRLPLSEESLRDMSLVDWGACDL